VTAAPHDGLVVEPATLERLAAAPGALTPEECMDRAERAAAALDLAVLDRAGGGDALLLWHSDSSEAWLNLWWQERDTGYHDHDGSCVGVYVIEGVARNEPLVYGQPRRVHEYTAGNRFAFLGAGIHRMEHDAGAITIHVYSPPLRAIGHYEVEDGELRRRPGPPDGQSAPSPQLLKALTSSPDG
jgi:hypothetical protein